jgi:hypothetical protein
MMQVRTIKGLGIGVVTVLAVTAIVGTSTTSATNDFTAACKVKLLACPEASQYKAGALVKGNLKAGTKAVFTGSLKVECDASTVGLELTGSSLAPILLGRFTEVTFTKCTTCPKVTAALGSFGPPHLKNIGGLKGRFILLDPEVFLESCFGFAKCTVKAAVVELDADTSVEPATVKAVSEKLSVSGFGCGSEGTWTAEYVLTAPTPFLIES